VRHQREALEHAFGTFSESEVTVLNVITPLDEPFSEGQILPVTGKRREEERVRAS
jgi:hypothetical protein